MLNKANKELLKSVGIKAGFGIVAVLADTLAGSLTGFNIPGTYAAIIGMLLGEVSHWAHIHYDLGGRVARAVVPKAFRN